MKRFFSLVLGALAMLAVALLFAFVTMRVAIHGSEVEVPDLVGRTADDATHATSRRGLNLSLVNRFYSTTVPAGHIISQFPLPGTIVRREWEVRAIESLGPQKVSIPDVSGMGERAATFNIRRLSLDLGIVAHIASAGAAEIVLAQTPPPNASGVDSPRVSLLLSQKQDLHSNAFVMPSLTGLSLAAATSRATATGLYVLDALPPDPASEPSPHAPPVSVAGQAVPFSVPSPSSISIVVSQSPASGHRVVKGEGVRLVLGAN